MDDEKLVRLFSQASASGWSLHSSIQLQDWLENFTKWINVRADHVATQVNNLVDQTSKVETDLRNTYNKFRLLSNYQFVENRVLDEDETAASESTRHVESKQAPFQSYENDIVPRYKEAISTAWKAYDHSRRGDSKSSSLEDFQRDRYRRRLPYIIGSEDFERDNYCGLQEVCAEYSMSKPSMYDNDFDKHQGPLEARPVFTGATNEREVCATGSDTSDIEKQGEPVVSAALDFKAMLEAALRGPYITYDPVAPNFTQGNVGDRGSYSLGKNGNATRIRSGEDYSTADIIPFSSTKITGDFLDRRFSDDAGAPHKGHMTVTLQSSSNSSFEDNSRVSSTTMKNSLPVIATEQNNEGTFTGTQSSPSLLSRLQIRKDKKQEKGSSSAQDWSTPSLDIYFPSGLEDTTEVAEGDQIGIGQHEDNSSVNAFDSSLFRKSKALPSNKKKVERGLFDDDIEEVNDEILGEMDLRASLKLDTKEQHSSCVQDTSIRREELVDRFPENEILNHISKEDSYPLGNKSAISTISNMLESSLSKHGSDYVGGTNAMMDIKKSLSSQVGSNIVPAFTLGFHLESEKQISEQADNSSEEFDQKSPQVLAAKQTGIFGSKDNDDDNSDDFSSSSSTENQGKEFMTLKQDTFTVNPSPAFTSTDFHAESQGKTILPSQSRLLQSTTVKHVSATSSPEHFLSTRNLKDHDGADISITQPHVNVHESSISEASSSYPVTGSTADKNEVRSFSSESGAEAVEIETPTSALFRFPKEKSSLYDKISNTPAGPTETIPSMSAVLFADEDEDQEDALFAPLQVKPSREIYNSNIGGFDAKHST